MKDLKDWKQTANCHARCTSKRGPCQRHVTHGVKCWYHGRKSPGLNVTKSKIPKAGLGLFTTKHIKKGGEIDEFKGPSRTAAEVDKFPLAEQAMCIPKKSTGKFIDVAGTRSCYARYANEAPSQKKVNADIEEKKVRGSKRSKVELEATKDLPAWTEIETDYGVGYPRDYKHWRKGVHNYAPGVRPSGKHRGKTEDLLHSNLALLNKLGQHVTTRRRR